MSQDGSHLKAGFSGIVPMLTTYGFNASQDVAQMLQQFTEMNNNLLPYAGWEATKWTYHQPDDVLQKKSAVFFHNQTLWIYDGVRSRVIKQIISDTQLPDDNIAHFEYRGNQELIQLETAVDPAGILGTFILYFLGLPVKALVKARLLDPFPNFQRLFKDSPGMQIPPSFPSKDVNLDAVGMQGLSSPEDIDVQIEKRLTQNLSSIAKSAHLIGGGNYESSDARQHGERNAQITRTVLGWYMLVKVMLRRPTVMRLLSMPNMEEYLQQASISNSGNHSITSYDTVQTLQEWLNVIYVDATSIMQPDVSKQLARLSAEKYTKLQNQVSIDTAKYQAALSTYLGLQQNAKHVINIEYLAVFFEKLVSENTRTGQSEIALVYEILLQSMISWLSRADGASKIVDLLEGNFLDNARKTSQTLSNIITYVRVTTRPPDLYNKRFDVQINADEKNALYVGYCNDNIAFYGDDLKETEEFRNHIQKSARAQVLGSGEVNILQYPYRYLFGPFTRVMTPNLTNEECANRCTSIIAALVKGESVLLVGYGASGAGKTSSLIYLNDFNTPVKERDGILIHLCHNEAIKREYSQMSVSVTEMFASQQNPREAEFRPKTFTDKATGNKVDTVIFVLDNDRFKVHGNIEYNNTLSGEVKSLEGQEMGAVVLYLLDQDRKIAATTNNPVSSRSHTLVFVRMGVSPNAPYLIVGDFAGVENRFDCDDWNVLNKFRKVGKNGRRFYDDYHQDDRMVCDPTVIDKAYKSMIGGAETFSNEENEFEQYLDSNDQRMPLDSAYDEMQKTIPCLGKDRKLDQSSGSTLQDAVTSYYSIFPIAEDDQNIMQAMGIASEPHDCGLETVKLYSDPDEKTILRSTEFLNKFEQMAQKVFVRKPNEKDSLPVHAAYVSRQLMRWALSETEIKSSGPDGTATQMRGDLASVPLLASQKIKMFGFDFQDLGPFWKTGMDGNDFKKIRYYVRNHEMYGLFKNLFRFKKGAIPKEIEAKDFESFIKELFLMRSQLLRKKFAYMEDAVGKLKRFHQRKIEIENKLFQICNCRSYEGVFINDSLRQTRNVIAAIVIEQLKKKNAVKVIPPFFDTCMYMQCRPLSGSCYNDAKKQQNVGDSAIFRAIQDRFQQDSSSTAMNSLKIAIFSVLNLSRDANNPPAAPYIDIEDIKQEIDRIETIASLKEMQMMPSLMSKLKEACNQSGLSLYGLENEKLRQLLEQVKQKHNLPVELVPDLEVAAQQVAEALPAGTFKDVADLISRITTERNFLTIAAKFNQFDNPLIPEDKLNNLVEMLKLFSKQLGEDVVRQVRVLVNDLKSTFDMKKASSLVLLIDNINAISALGTLEFTDRMAKYAMTNKSCRISETSSDFVKSLNQSMLEEIKAFKFMPISNIIDNDSYQ